MDPPALRFGAASGDEIDAGEEDSLDVQQRFDAARAIFVEQLPLGFGETEMVRSS